MRWRFYRPAEPKRGLAAAVVLFGLFALAVYSGVMWSRSVENSTTFWAANGVLAAGLLLLPRRLGWGFAAACIGLNVLVNVAGGLPPVFNLVYTSLNVFIAVAVAGLVRTFCGAALDLGRLRRFLPFAGLTLLVAAVEGFIGSSLTVPGTEGDFLVIWARWTACDATGMILGLPATLMLMRRVNPLYAGPAGRAERLALIALLTAASFGLFALADATAFLLTFPMLVFAAFRLGSAWSFLAVWLMAQAATVQTLANRGPIAAFQGGEAFTELAHLQLYVLSLVLAAAFATSALAERMRAELRMRRKAASAAASQARVEQMARTRERFLAVISHEIRTPLNGILGFAGALSARGDLSSEARRQVEMIGRSTDRLMELVEDILDFSRLETGKLELEARPADLAQTLRAGAARAAETAQARGLAFDIVTDAAGHHLFDARRLGQIVSHLADNAVKFTEAGQVEVRLAVRPGAEADRVELSVSDTGPGVPDHRRGELFQPFAQMDASTSRRHEGTGLGLAVVRSLVEAMGGTIAYQPGPTGGACFRIRLDLPRAPGPAPEPAAPVEPAETERAPRILVVDDHPVNREVARLILEAVGCDVAECEGGAEAVEAAAAQTYDVILMDIRMPGMDGLEATRAIRAGGGVCAGAPILAVTADVMREDVERCRAAGMNGHVPKPLSQGRLIQAVQTALTGGEAFPQPLAA